MSTYIDSTPRGLLARRLATETVQLLEGWMALHNPGPDGLHRGDCLCNRKADR